MKALTDRLFKRLNSDTIERDVEEELRSHLELLTQELLQQNTSFAHARDAALKRFGNVEQIKDECVEIIKSGNPLTRAMKFLFTIVFLAGVLVRVFSTEIPFVHVGDTLIAVGAAGRLFLYVRGLNPSRFRSESESSAPLRLNEEAQPSINAREHGSLTPVERVIAQK